MKLQHFAQALDSSLVDIKYLSTEGELSFEFIGVLLDMSVGVEEPKGPADHTADSKSSPQRLFRCSECFRNRVFCNARFMHYSHHMFSTSNTVQWART